jgi:tetratricopeptide (TPR) repeat protein
MADLGIMEVKLRCPGCNTVFDVTLPRGYEWKASIDIPGWGTLPVQNSTPDQPSGGVPAAWYADPLGRHQYRYWDGAAWTHNVADGGQTSVDSVDASPAVDEEIYVRSCSQAAFSEEKEERTFRSDPAFQTVLDPLNSQHYPAAIKAAEDLLPRFADFDLPYNLLGSAYRATDQLQQSRKVFERGLANAKRKAYLLTEMGETLWRLGDVHQAVYYWCQAVHCLSSNPIDYNAYLLLSYVAKGCGLGDIEQRLLGRVDAMQGGQPRLDPATASRLSELVRSRKDHAISRALQDIDARYLQAAGGGVQPGSEVARVLAGHLQRIRTNYPELNTFLSQYFGDADVAKIASAASDKLRLTLSDGEQHSVVLERAEVAYHITTLPVDMGQAREWFGRTAGGYTGFLGGVWDSALPKTTASVWCHVIYGSSAGRTWVHMALCPVQQPAPIDVTVMPIEFLTSEERQAIGL